MAEDKNIWIEAISKLIKLTQEGRLEWRTASEMEFPESRTETDNENINSVFISTYRNKELRIYKRKFFIRTLPATSKALRNLYAFSKAIDSQDRSKLSARVVLEIIDRNGNVLWTFPAEEILNDLLTAVEYQVAGVNEFLTDILNEE